MFGVTTKPSLNPTVRRTRTSHLAQLHKETTMEIHGKSNFCGEPLEGYTDLQLSVAQYHLALGLALRYLQLLSCNVQPQAPHTPCLVRCLVALVTQRGWG